VFIQGILNLIRNRRLNSENRMYGMCTEPWTKEEARHGDRGPVGLALGPIGLG
jgi:hypothetical protein